eukprot:g9126.t1
MFTNSHTTPITGRSAGRSLNVDFINASSLVQKYTSPSPEKITFHSGPSSLSGVKRELTIPVVPPPQPVFDSSQQRSVKSAPRPLRPHKSAPPSPLPIPSLLPGASSNSNSSAEENVVPTTRPAKQQEQPRASSLPNSPTDQLAVPVPSFAAVTYASVAARGTSPAHRRSSCPSELPAEHLKDPHKDPHKTLAENLKNHDKDANKTPPANESAALKDVTKDSLKDSHKLPTASLAANSLTNSKHSPAYSKMFSPKNVSLQQQDEFSPASKKRWNFFSA